VGELVLRGIDQPARGRIGHGVQHDQVAEALQQVRGEAARVVARLDDPVDRPGLSAADRRAFGEVRRR